MKFKVRYATTWGAHGTRTINLPVHVSSEAEIKAYFQRKVSQLTGYNENDVRIIEWWRVWDELSN